MTLDLNRFTREFEAVAPVVGGKGQIWTRKFTSKVPDGWYKLSVGNEVNVEREATQLERYKALDAKKFLKGYVLGTEIVPYNFDNFKKRGYDSTVKVHFLDLPIFTMAKVVEWGDQFFFFEEGYHPEFTLLRDIRQAYTDEHVLEDIPGMTPEIRYYTLLLHMQRGMIEAVEELKKFKDDSPALKRQLKSFKAKLGDQIRLAVELAGGKYHSHSKQGKNYLVTWELGGQRVRSIVGSTLRINDAGFCLEGDDKKHSLSSIVNLAHLFQEDGPLYITRE